MSAIVKDAWATLRWKLPTLALLTFVNAVLEGATIASLLPLLGSLGGEGLVANDRVSRITAEGLRLLNVSPSPGAVAGLIIVLIAASAITFIAYSHLASRLQAFYVASWQQRIFAGFLAADFRFFVSHRTGDLVAAITNEPSRIGLVFSQVNLIIAAALFIFVQIVVALFIAPWVVALLVGFGVLLFALTRWWSVRAARFGAELTKVNADLMVDANEIIGGAKFVKATATEDRALSRFVRAVGRLETLSFGNSFDGQVVRAIFEYSGGLLIVGLIVLGPKLLSVDVSAVLVIVAIFVRLFPKITALRQNLQIVDFHAPAFDVLSGLLREASLRHEASGNDTPPGWPGSAPASIALENVSVLLGSRELLTDVNIDIPAGAFVVFTGHTGSGKTTLLDCILGLRRPSSGVVKIDKYAIDQLPSFAWRRGIGYLGQDPVLFNASIGENLRWINPQTTDEEIGTALEAAAANFVGRLPEGLDTVVGNHGSRMSGGERQRIALARALLGSPRLLVLDEATSSLDIETEELVTEALVRLKGRITIVAISHRPALIRNAEIVFHLSNGKVERVEKPDSQVAGEVQSAPVARCH
nr:ABC transporter ATP-binding protein [Bradyrhizobium sp. G127]